MTNSLPLEPKDELDLIFQDLAKSFREFEQSEPNRNTPAASVMAANHFKVRIEQALQSYVEKRVRLAVQKERSQMLIIDTKRIEVNPKSHHYIKLETEEGNE